MATASWTWWWPTLIPTTSSGAHRRPLRPSTPARSRSPGQLRSRRLRLPPGRSRALWPAPLMISPYTVRSLKGERPMAKMKAETKHSQEHESEADEKSQGELRFSFHLCPMAKMKAETKLSLALLVGLALVLLGAGTAH